MQTKVSCDLKYMERGRVQVLMLDPNPTRDEA